MTKQLLLTVSPQEALNILNGKQTLLLRKRVPKGYVGWVWLGVSKGKPFLMHAFDNTYYLHDMTEKYRMKNDLNGSIVARYWHEEVETIKYEVILPNGYENFDGEWVDNSAYGYWLSDYIIEKSMLSDYEIEGYGNGKDLYAIHISKLEILDKPMALGEFYREEYAVMPNGVFPAFQPLTSLPSTYQYVYVEDK